MAGSKQQAGKRVLWLDPFFQGGRPTTQSIHRALPWMLDRGWQIEIWCLDHDGVDARAEVKRLPRARWLRLLEPLWFWFLAWLRLTWLRLWAGKWDIVHTTGPDIPGADVMSLHFHNRTWIGLQWREQAWSIKEKLRILHTMIGLLQETVVLHSKRWRVILPVSEGLAERIRPQLASEKRIQVLPNLLDETRFHSGVRQQYREVARSQIHATETDFIFIFVSTGHYQRKGLWAALRSLDGCRTMARNECGLRLRFLIVGAGEKAQASLIPQLNQTVPDWRDWVSLIPPTPEVERWYAAADAFLFPSRYETFSLVALEAAACGLPLLVTPYDGHEMYLKEGVNGCLLPWEPEGMATRIGEFLKMDRHHLKPGQDRCIHASGYAEVLDQTYLEILRERSL